ncbi:MAG: ABC transporter ATP-binding protein [Chlamydiales bacterium]
MNQPVLRATKLRKSFFHPQKVDVLREISLEVAPGTSVAIMGASGEGKSTLLHILGTLDEANSGQLEIVGKRTDKHSASELRNQHIGFIFQSFNLLEDYSVLQNVLMPALIAGKNIAKGTPSYLQACALLESVGLAHRKHYPAKLLSGGEKQRVAIARALCNNPEIILADEPSGNLDHETSQTIHQILMHCVKQENKSLIVVTHDVKLAKLCDQRFTLIKGELIYGENNG